jgi:capsular polysaccharide biosynthesis protein
MVAVFAGVLLAFLFDYLDDRLHSAEMVEESLGLDVIAEVPRGEVS